MGKMNPCNAARFADDNVRIERTLINDGVYTQEAGDAVSDALYFGEMAVVDRVATGEMAPCTRMTPVGVACYCNHGIISGHPIPGWGRAWALHYIRPGWHVTNPKGRHAGGNVCYRDREPTPEERARYHSRQIPRASSF